MDGGIRMLRLKVLSFIFLLAQPAWSFASESLDIATSKCAPETSQEPKLKNQDFEWGYNLNTLAEAYQKTYESGKRLRHRAFFDSQSQSFILPKLDLNKNIQYVKLTQDFIVSVTQQVEEALRREYAQYIFFPDMGHSHLLVPQDYYDKEIKDIPVKDQYLAYEKMLGFSGTKILYHAAEQLQMTDPETKTLLLDPFIQWRYYTRNIVGGLFPPAKVEIHKLLDGPYNTVREVPGYRYWGAGFDISASKDGCFAFKNQKGEVQFFDLSLYSLE